MDLVIILTISQGSSLLENLIGCFCYFFSFRFSTLFSSLCVFGDIVVNSSVTLSCLSHLQLLRGIVILKVLTLKFCLRNTGTQLNFAILWMQLLLMMWILLSLHELFMSLYFSHIQPPHSHPKKCKITPFQIVQRENWPIFPCFWITIK